MSLQLKHFIVAAKQLHDNIENYDEKMLTHFIEKSKAFVNSRSKKSSGFSYVENAIDKAEKRLIAIKAETPKP